VPGGGPRHRLRHGAHSSDRMAPGALLSVHLAEGMMQEDVGGARRVRAGVISDDGVEAEPGLHQLAFEPAVEKIAGRCREQVIQRAQIFRGKPAEPVAEARRLDYLADGCDLESSHQIRRRLQRELAQQVGARIEGAVEGIITLRIGGTEIRETAFGAAFACEQISTVRGRDKVLRAALDQLEPVLDEAKIGDDLGAQQAHGIGGDRIAKSRPELLGDRRSAHDRPAFDQLDFEPRHAEVGGASQPIVTRTDDDDVIRLH
jgi:hypothetical protein